MLDSAAALTIRLRWFWFTASLLLIVFAVSGFQFFKFDGSPSSYFEDEYGPYTNFVGIEDRYGKDSRIFIMLEPKDGTVFTQHSLSALETMTEQAWYITDVFRVESLANFQHSYSEGDDLYVEPLIENANSYDANKIQAIKNIALSDESLIHRLISPEGKFTALTLEFNIGDKNEQEAQFELAAEVYSWIETFETDYPDINVFVTGDIISTYNNSQIIINDVMTMIPTMFLIMFVVLGLIMRTISGVFAAFIIAISAMLTGIGLGSWFGITFSMMTMNTVMIIITVTLAHCIHILNHFFHAYRDPVVTKASALLESLRVNLIPVSITSLTTVLGFLTLNTSNMPPAVSLGNVSALGVASSWIYSLTMLPCLILLFPCKRPQQQAGHIEQWMVKLSDWIIAQQKLLLLFVVFLSALMTYLALQNTVNDRFSEAIKKPHTFRTHNEYIDQNFGGLYSYNFDVDAHQEQGVTKPEYLAYLDAFTQWLRAQPEITSVYSFVDVMKRLNRSMHGDDPAYYRLPESAELAAQYLLLYEMSLPMGMDLNNLMTLDKSATRLLATSAAMDTHQIFALQQRINQWQQDNLPQHMQKEGASLAMMWSSLSKDSLITSFEGSFIALLVISVIMIMVLRSIRYGIISLIPNVLPAVMGFGIWALVSGELSMGLMSVVIITMGIVVDDTVHFLSKYKYAKDHLKANTEEAIRYSFRYVGTALWTTTIVLVAGFSLLMMSQAKSNSDLGFLTSVIIISALILDFFLLPPLLLLLDKKRFT